LNFGSELPRTAEKQYFHKRHAYITSTANPRPRMQVESLPIAGAVRLTLQAFSDDRGFFKEAFRASLYAESGIREAFVQDNVSESKAMTLRGLHGDPRMAKLVQVLQGSVFDVLVDVRRDSPTYLKSHGEILRAGEHIQLYIPAGCLHGFLALEDGTIFTYKQTAEYDPALEFGVAWNDPDLGIAWPLAGASPRLSQKDALNPRLRDL
jgi:dTDP-4-dehydrorhamnose 3,5-epimerase